MSIPSGPAPGRESNSCIEGRAFTPDEAAAVDAAAVRRTEARDTEARDTETGE